MLSDSGAASSSLLPLAWIMVEKKPPAFRGMSCVNRWAFGSFVVARMMDVPHWLEAAATWGGGQQTGLFYYRFFCFHDKNINRVVLLHPTYDVKKTKKDTCTAVFDSNDTPDAQKNNSRQKPLYHHIEFSCLYRVERVIIKRLLRLTLLLRVW